MKMLIVICLTILTSVWAQASNGSAPGSPQAALDQVMNLRMEVESLNDACEREKVQVKSNYEKAIERLAQLKDETAKQKSSLILTKARIAGFKNREAESRRISGQDEARLKKVISEFHSDIKTMLPAGRVETRQQLADLEKSLTEKSTEEAIEELSKIVRSELSLARGTHLFKETHQVRGKMVSLEIARVGNVFAYVADTEGRFGVWKPGMTEPQFDLGASDIKAAKQVFSESRDAKKTISLNGAILDFLESGSIERASEGGTR